MNRLKQATAALLLLAFAPFVRAQQILTIETKWNEKTVSITTTGVTSMMLDVAGFGAYAAPVLGNPARFNGVDGTVYGAGTVVTSTWTDVAAFDYTMYSSATLAATFAGLQIAQTLKTPPAAGTNAKTTSGFNSPAPTSNFFSAPVISTSTVITIPNGVLFQHAFRAQVKNPIFYLTGLTANDTYTLTVDYGVPHIQ